MSGVEAGVETAQSQAELPALAVGTPAVAGSHLSRAQLFARSAAFLAAGVVVLVLLLIGGVFPSGLVTFIAMVGFLVLTFLGVDRFLWGLKRVKVDLLSILSAAWVTILALLALIVQWLPLKEHMDVAKTLYVDGNKYVVPFTTWEYPLGTNRQGLDLLARSLYGARASLTISLGAITIGLIIGGIIGIIAGYYRGGVDSIVDVFTNALLAVPPLILLIVLAAVLQPRIRNMMFALALLTIPTMVRLARANTIAYSQRSFVLAAQSIGASRVRIMVRELLPNVLPPMLSLAVVVISGLIVAEASLSFLGLGIPPPEPTWGNMISEAQIGETMRQQPHMLLVPGAFLFLTVFSVNLLGERAQQRWDPRGAQA